QIALDVLLDPRSGELPQMAQRQVSSLKRNLSRLTALTNDLLTIDKLEAGKLELDLQSVPSRSLVEEAVQTLQDLAQQKKLELHNNCKNEFLQADRGRVLQVLTNLLSNAIKFSPQGGSIVIESAEDAGFVTMKVTDQGPGIPPDDQKNIFSKFF